MPRTFHDQFRAEPRHMGTRHNIVGTVQRLESRAAMKMAFLAMLLVGVAGAQNGDAAFRKWWPGFQAAVAKHDAKAVAHGMLFPQPWENDPAIREIKSE